MNCCKVLNILFWLFAIFMFILSVVSSIQRLYRFEQIWILDDQAKDDVTFLLPTIVVCPLNQSEIMNVTSPGSGSIKELIVPDLVGHLQVCQAILQVNYRTRHLNNLIEIGIESGSAFNYLIHVCHDKNFFPGGYGLVGCSKALIQKRRDNVIGLLIRRTKKELRDSDYHPCVKETDKQKPKQLLDCLEVELEEQIGCHSPKSTNESCSLESYQRFIATLYDHASLFKQTGCKERCLRDHYEVEELYRGFQDDSNRRLKLLARIESSSPWMEKQIMFYSVCDVVGDIGGALGLFLGYSILQILQGCTRRAQTVKLPPLSNSKTNFPILVPSK